MQRRLRCAWVGLGVVTVLVAAGTPPLRAQSPQHPPDPHQPAPVQVAAPVIGQPTDSAAQAAADSLAVVAGDYARLLPVAGQFRVCADPNALPYSNNARAGFENKLAELIAADFHAAVTYTWYPQRRGFVRNTLKDYQCDVVMGVPSTLDMVLTTNPYYRSTYVFITRKDRGLDIRSFDDPRLKTMKIGVYDFGNDYVNTPPVHALLERGVPPENFIGYSLYGDYAKPNPPADLIHAVARGDVPVAVGWGPIAGYFAQRESVPLNIVPVSPAIDLPFRPYVYDMSLGVRRDDGKWLKEALDQVLTRHRAEIRQLLLSYGIPLVERPGSAALTEK